MTDFIASKKKLTDFHNGVKYQNNVDSPNADDFNNVIESQLYSQEIAEAVNGIGTNPPNTTNANQTGTPNVYIETLNDGTKRLVFENLKGATGAQGQAGADGNVVGISIGTPYTFDNNTITPLIFTLSNGTTKIVEVSARDGSKGVGISNIRQERIEQTPTATITHLLVQYDNGSSETLQISASTGAQGEKGTEIYSIRNNGWYEEDGYTRNDMQVEYSDGAVSIFPIYAKNGSGGGDSTTNFVAEYTVGTNFGGKTLKFAKVTEHLDENTLETGAYCVEFYDGSKVVFAVYNGYLSQVKWYDAYGRTWTALEVYEGGTLTYMPITFADGTGMWGETYITGFSMANDNSATEFPTTITAEEFASKITATFTLE